MIHLSVHQANFISFRFDNAEFYMKRLRQYLSVSFLAPCGTKKACFFVDETSRKIWRHFCHSVPFRFLRTKERTSWAWFHGILIIFRWILYSIPNKIRLIDFVCCFWRRRFRRLVTQIIISYDIILTFSYILCRKKGRDRGKDAHSIGRLFVEFSVCKMI